MVHPSPTTDARVPDTLVGREYRVGATGVGGDYTAALLESLGGRVLRTFDTPEIHPAIEWARSGAMSLTGLASGPPLLAPGPLATCARAAVDALGLLAGKRWPSELDASALLGEHAAIFGLSRHGTTSAGGSCRLLRAADRWIALNLARPDDVALLPAWLGEGNLSDPWNFVAEHIARQPAAKVVERARLLGLPASLAVEPSATASSWFHISTRGSSVLRSAKQAPLVIDLSSLWAGPLCTQLLGWTGARVVKVESTRRPDGARFGPHAFFDLLNAGKASVALDFGAASDRLKLRRLVECADIVVESARPRALAQLGIDARTLVESVPGLTWLSITGYGRKEPRANWVAFGDDAGAAAGLAVATGTGVDSPLFCGDAIADPLTGIHAALCALASWQGGGGHLLDLSLCEVTAHVLGFGSRPCETRVHSVGNAWEVVAGTERSLVAPPRARAQRGVARKLGADTQAVLEELVRSC